MSTYELQRPRILSLELERRGMATAAAESFAWLLVARQPFAQRVGVPALTRELARRGMAPDAAHSAALMLVALDLLDSGRLFDGVVRALARFDTTGQGARAEALEASQIHRRLKRQMPHAEAWALRRRMEIAGFGIAATLLLACLVLL